MLEFSQCVGWRGMWDGGEGEENSKFKAELPLEFRLVRPQLSQAGCIEARYVCKYFYNHSFCQLSQL